jgi:predicted RNA-binding protein with PIN domain
MSLEYVIDGYNIINHPLFRAVNRKNKDSRIALLQFIRAKRLAGSPKNKITVVFDGYSTIAELSENVFNIELIFARKDTADEKIKKIVEGSLNPKNIVVVSDDKEIKFFIRSAGARSISVEEFMPHKEKSPGFLNEKDLLKTELTYSQIHKINQELKKIWLK